MHTGDLGKRKGGELRREQTDVERLRDPGDIEMPMSRTRRRSRPETSKRRLANSKGRELGSDTMNTSSDCSDRPLQTFYHLLDPCRKFILVLTTDDVIVGDLLLEVPPWRAGPGPQKSRRSPTLVPASLRAG